ncbi:MAG: peptidylprolyl isomerase [Proteobacteria bacterium]|nr:peptidylprolyl isomerase [Pseudomonadota bacterium]
METLETQLERVQTAIAAIESGAQEYRIDNRSVTKANLAALYARESSLKAAIARRDGNNVLYANTGRL